MPVHKIRRNLSPQAFELRAALVAEWRSPRADKSAEPVIYEVDPGADEPLWLYVVWSRWKDVSPTDRSDVILDAFEEIRGKEELVRIAAAIGLTPAEARAEGIAKMLGRDDEP